MTGLNDLTDVTYDTGTPHNLIVCQKVTLTSGANFNVFIGELAGATAANSTNATSENTAVGYQSMQGLTSGQQNTAIGYQSLFSNTTGYYNSAIGVNSLNANTTGLANTAIGYHALLSNVSGHNNIAIAPFALTNTTGSTNIGIGYNTGATLTTGSGNILIGEQVDVPSASTSNYLNIGGAITGDMTTGPALMNGFTGTTQSSGDSSTKIATTAFVQNAIGAITAGLDSRPSCRVATTAALTATYSNGSSGVGATLTNSGTQAAISIDGVSLAANDRVLVKNQATAAQNGIYKVTTVGSGSTNWVLTRTTDFNTASDTGVVEGAFTVIEEGTTLVGTFWIETGAGPFTIGTTAITFTALQLASTPHVVTYQYLTSGSSATYTTPANCKAIHVEAWGGGGGGGGGGASPTAGGAGGDTIFNSVHAKGGSGGSGGVSAGGNGGKGTTAGTGSATFRVIGSAGNAGEDVAGGVGNGGTAGSTSLGGAGSAVNGAAGTAAAANSGSGGAGATGGSGGGGGGQAGEYFILDISSPAATYTYTIGAAGSAGTGTNNGGAGGTGFIRVTEYY